MTLSCLLTLEMGKCLRLWPLLQLCPRRLVCYKYSNHASILYTLQHTHTCTYTPAPSSPVDLQVQSVFHISLNLTWAVPLQPNGNITQYTVSHKYFPCSVTLCKGYKLIVIFLPMYKTVSIFSDRLTKFTWGIISH